MLRNSAKRTGLSTSSAGRSQRQAITGSGTDDSAVLISGYVNIPGISKVVRLLRSRSASQQGLVWRRASSARVQPVGTKPRGGLRGHRR